MKKSAVSVVFTMCSLLALPIAQSVVSFAQSPPPPPSPGASLYSEGELLVRQGRKFERAAERFLQAAAKEPENLAYPLAAGCAYVDRIASLAHAAHYAQENADEFRFYEYEKAEWERDQKDPQSDRYGHGKPARPKEKVYAIKDDGIPYRLTRSEFAEQLSELCGKAQAAFDKGVSLARTPEEKAEAEYTRAWGYCLLKIYIYNAGGKVSPEQGNILSPGEEDLPKELRQLPLLEIKRIPPLKEIAAGFARATELVPENARYWESRGFAEDDPKKEREYLHKAAELAPKNVALWYRLFALEDIRRRNEPGISEPRTTLLNYLEQAARYDTTNAFPLYLLARYHYDDLQIQQMGSEWVGKSREKNGDKSPPFQQAATREAAMNALKRVEVGGSLPRLDIPHYLPPMPRLLRPAWEYECYKRDRDYLILSSFHVLAYCLRSHAWLAAEEKGGRDEANRAAKALITLAAQLMWDDPLRGAILDKEAAHKYIAGNRVRGQGLVTRQHLYELWGDKEALASLKEEEDRRDTGGKEFQMVRLLEAQLFETINPY
jgi:hypothetical protein